MSDTIKNVYYTYEPETSRSSELIDKFNGWYNASTIVQDLAALQGKADNLAYFNREGRPSSMHSTSFNIIQLHLSVLTTWLSLIEYNKQPVFDL